MENLTTVGPVLSKGTAPKTTRSHIIDGSREPKELIEVVGELCLSLHRPDSPQAFLG